MTPPVDSLGIVEALQEKRAAMVANLSPEARHAAFPTVYARPAPAASDEETLREKLRETQKALDESRAHNGCLQKTVKTLQDELAQYVEAAARVSIKQRAASIDSVQRQFLAEYNALAAAEKRDPLTNSGLLGSRRSRTFAWPRQVCMWLCCKICEGKSLPTIGLAFGGRDHTTCMHAKRRAPEIMQARPDLNLVALRVIAHFEALQ